MARQKYGKIVIHGKKKLRPLCQEMQQQQEKYSSAASLAGSPSACRITGAVETHIW